MAQFEPKKQQIESANATVVFIAAEKREGFFKPEKFLARRHISFPFLLDEDRAVTKAWGVYNRIALDAYNIARPATFVVGRDGIVKYAYVGKHQLDRAPMEQVLGSLQHA
jgi:peroxiredoxin